MIRRVVVVGGHIIRPHTAGALHRLEAAQRALQSVEQVLQYEARLFGIAQQLLLVDRRIVLLVLAAQPGGHAHQAEEGWAQTLGEFAPAVDFLGFEPVAPFRRNQFGGALGGAPRKDGFFLFGNYEGFRQSLALSSVSVVPDSQARQGLLPNAATGRYAPVANLKSSILPYMAFWPQPNGPELLSNGIASGAALSYNNPKESICEDRALE